ncbi:uroporphyrinogen-III synthase [Vibrio sp.]|uniref:uroporphyrinogen-III synthase n=1 Tax=Vibrio sp. TaxID=678 RepID=UPI003D0CE097
MAVLVTRPEQQGQQLCQQLAGAGIETYHLPLIEFLPGQQLAALPGSISQYQIIIAVSQHAVDFAQQTLNEAGVPWPSHCVYLAVGQKTAQILSKACQHTVHYPSISDSEHLLAMDVMQTVHNQQILILRGNGGRELIYDTLILRGAKVDYLEAYQRKNVAFDAHNLVPAWQAQGIDSLIITSSGQLTHFVSQIDVQDLPWLLTLRLYVPSERIASDARQLGFCDVINTGSAANADIAAALQPSTRTLSNDK